MIEVSVIVATTRARGLDLVINGLLGQVEKIGYERVEDVEGTLLGGHRAVMRTGSPIYKRLDNFELIFVDGSYNGEAREEEIASARLLAHGEEAARRNALTTFEFIYHRVAPTQHLAGGQGTRASLLGLYRAGIKKARGNILILLADLTYITPEFVVAHRDAHRAKYDLVTVSPVHTRIQPHDVGKNTMLGVCVHDGSETVADQLIRTHKMASCLHTGEIRCCSFERNDFRPRFKPKQGPPLNVLVHAALEDYEADAAICYQDSRMASMRIRPQQFGLDPDDRHGVIDALPVMFATNNPSGPEPQTGSSVSLFTRARRRLSNVLA